MLSSCVIYLRKHNKSRKMPLFFSGYSLQVGIIKSFFFNNSNFSEYRKVWFIKLKKEKKLLPHNCNTKIIYYYYYAFIIDIRRAVWLLTTIVKIATEKREHATVCMRWIVMEDKLVA